MCLLFSTQKNKSLNLQNYFGWGSMRKYITKKNYDEGSICFIKELSLFTLWFSKGIHQIHDLPNCPFQIPDQVVPQKSVVTDNNHIFFNHRERGCDINWLIHPNLPTGTVTSGNGIDLIKSKRSRRDSL